MTLKKLAEGIHGWSVFSEEKQYDFNGLHLDLGNGSTVLVDPVKFDEATAVEIERLGKPACIIITNKDHRRAAPEARERFGAPIWVHEGDAAALGCPADRTFRGGELLHGVLRTIEVRDGKSPGETALHWPERSVLILGDALIGRPPGSLSLLPVPKVPDHAKARLGLLPHAALEVDTILVGDGVSILSGAGAVLRKLLS